MSYERTQPNPHPANPMHDSPKKKRPLGSLALLVALVFLLTPLGSNLMREGFLSFKNGNIVGDSAPTAVDGVSIASSQPETEAGASRWTLWTFFSPT